MARTKSGPDAGAGALPAAGDLLAVPLGRGFWGACWVARQGLPEPATVHLGPHIVVASADWFGKRKPTPADLGAPRLLHIDHDGYDLPALWNINQALDSGVERIGRLARPPAAGRAPWITAWSRMAYVMERQRVWNLDRPASAAAYAQQKLVWAQAGQREAERTLARTAARRKTLTIAKLRRGKLRGFWKGAMPAPRLAEARAQLGDLLDALDAQPGDARRQRAALRAAVTRFNRWNDQHGLIETGEREALHELLCDIGAAAGLGEIGAAIDRWRDW